jgi:hypothetical protein
MVFPLQRIIRIACHPNVIVEENISTQGMTNDGRMGKIQNEAEVKFSLCLIN